MKILHTGDWHYDLPNLDDTTWAADHLIQSAPEVDLVINTGDFAVHRGYINPHVSFCIRRDVYRLNALTRMGSILLMGNHDQSFHADRCGTVGGVFDGVIMSATSRMLRVIERPLIHLFDSLDNSGLRIAVVSIPTPNKYWLAAANGGFSDDQAGALVDAMIRGKIVEARRQADVVIVDYHGTVIGAQASTERVMTAGMDIAVSREAFRGASAVMLGHIHHKQVFAPTEGLPPMIYPGSLAPATWGERRLEPAAYVWDFSPDGDAEWEEITIPVRHQMIDRELELSGSDADTISRAVREFVSNDRAISAGTRVRIRVTAPAAALAQLRGRFADDLRSDLDLREVRIIPEPIDAGIVRLDLGDGWSLEDALERYMSFKEIDADARPAVRNVAREIETMIVDKNRDAHYEFKPTHMRASNWCQYEEFAVDFGQMGNVTAIVGPNFAGKSNLARFILFMLYKKQTSGRRLSELVLQPKRRMDGEIGFVCNGTRYQINRTIKIATDGSATCDTGFFYHAADGSGLRPLNEGKATETQAAIERLIGPLDLFLANAFAGQNQIDRLLDLTPSDMKDLLMTVFQRDFDGRQEIARERYRTIERDLEADRSQRQVWSKIVADKAVVNASLEDAIKRKSAAETDLASCPADDRFSAAVSEAVRDDERKRGLNRELDQIDREISDTTDELASIKSSDDARGDLLDEIEKLKREIGEAVDVAAATQAVVDAGAARDRNAQKNKEVIDRVAESHAAADAAYHTALDLVDLRKGKISAINRKIERAERARELLADVPCEGATWGRMNTGAKEIEHVSMAGCQFLGDARDLVTGLEDLREERDTAVTSLSEAEADLEVKRAAAKDALNLLEGNRGIAKRQADEDAKIIDGARAALEDAARAVDRREAKRQRLDSLTAESDQQAETRNERFRLEDQLGRLQDRQAKKLAEISAAGETADALARAEATLAANQRRRAEAAAAVESASADVIERTAEMKAITRAESSILEIDGRIADRETEARAVGFYREAMHRDGLPFLLLEGTAIPRLQALANEYLEETAFRLTISSERELQTGEQRNAVYITFTDHRGTHDLSAASGYQRTAIGMALTAALADLTAEATGSRIWFALQDEGFGTMDTENLDCAKRTIRKIAQGRRWFWFISHVPGMSENADTVIEVVDLGGKSTLQLMEV